ncbi:MAG: LVIVD repeat-containing protein [bacterium]
MKKVFKFVLLAFTLSFFLLVFNSLSQCQSWYPPYFQTPYSQTGYYLSPPINSNINRGVYYGGSSTGYYPYPSNYLPSQSTLGYAYLTAELHLAYSVADGDYIYVLYQNMATGTGTGGIAGEAGLAIFEASGSDDYDYVSHIDLYNGGSASGIVPIPLGIVVQDDLAVIGAAKGTVYFVDISDKDDPEIIKEFVLVEIDEDSYSGLSDAYPLAMKDDVLFVVMSQGVMGEDAETTIYAYDISNPDDIDEDDDLLDSYTIDDFDIHTMVIDSGYLYAAGNEANDEPSILVLDISDPEHLSLKKTFTNLGGDDYSHVSLEVNGDYLMATVSLDEDSSDYEDHGFKFKIINISNPENPALVYSSGRLEGVPLPDQKNIACSDNHVFVLTTIGDYGAWVSGATWWLEANSFDSKVYVFDVTDPSNADRVETSSKYDGAGRGLYVVATDRLCLHTDTELIIFDISDPTDMSLEGTVDIYNIMDGKLDDTYKYYYGMASTPYGYYNSPYIYNYGYRNAAFNGYNTYPFPNNNYFNYPSYPGNFGYRYGNNMGGIYPGGYGYNTGYYNYGPGYGTFGYPNYGTGNLPPYSNYPSGYGYGYQPPYGNTYGGYFTNPFSGVYFGRPYPGFGSDGYGIPNGVFY